MESKIDIKKTNNFNKENINKEKEKEKENKIVKKESGVYHDGKKLLYEPDDEFEVRSCCGSICNVDKPFMEFLAKTIVSLSVLSFCFIQLSNGEQSEFASSTISLILGTYLGSSNTATKEKRK